MVDGIKHYYLSKNFGFSARREGPLSGNIVAYDNIDEKLCEIHKWLQFMKFVDFGDHMMKHITKFNGYMSREEAVEQVYAVKYSFPYEYLEEFLHYHELSKKNFLIVLRNGEIIISFKSKGEWKLKYELICII